MKSSIVVVRPTGQRPVAKPFDSYSEGLEEFRKTTVASGIVELWCSRRGIAKRNKFDIPKPESAKAPEAPKAPEPVKAPKASKAESK